MSPWPPAMQDGVGGGKTRRHGARRGSGHVYFPTLMTSRAVDAAGKAQVFAGYYRVAPVNPAIQEPPFRPLQIQSGKLAPVETAFEATEPGSCE